MKLFFFHDDEVLEEETRQVRGREWGAEGDTRPSRGAGKLQRCPYGVRENTARVGEISGHGGLERGLGGRRDGWGAEGMAGAGGQEGWLRARGMRGEGAEALEEAGAGAAVRAGAAADGQRCPGRGAGAAPRGLRGGTAAVPEIGGRGEVQPQEG